MKTRNYKQSVLNRRKRKAIFNQYPTKEDIIRMKEMLAIMRKRNKEQQEWLDTQTYDQLSAEEMYKDVIKGASIWKPYNNEDLFLKTSLTFRERLHVIARKYLMEKHNEQSK